MEKGEKMVKVKEDLTGKTFGRLLVLERADDCIDSRGWHRLCWKCKCTCKNQTILNVLDRSLKTGNTRSCGCLHKEQLVERSKKQFKKYNDYEVQEDYVIMYTTKGEPFYIDLEDFWRVKDICWCKNNNGYLTGKDTKSHKTVLLHRYIMNCPNGFDVDHLKPKTEYDNRKSNLVIKTRVQNQWNKNKPNSQSGVMGVCWHKAYSKWRSRIVINGKEIHLGYFENLEDAIKARKEAEEKYHGEWSYDNCQKKWRDSNA